MFAILNNVQHGERRKTIANVYAKSYIMTRPVEELIQEKTRDFMACISRQLTSDVFLELHYLGLDIITKHVYGESGETFSLKAKPEHTDIILDIVGIAKADWIWSSVHFPKLTEWATEPGWFNSVCQLLGIVRKGTFPYTTMREYSFDQTIKYYKNSVGSEIASVMSKMVKFHVSQGGDWSDEDLAAEGADQYRSSRGFSNCSVLAGEETTAETLTYLIWQISRPGYEHIQDKLRAELKTIEYDSTGMPSLRAADKLPYLDAVIKETLRVYPSIPMSEPRVVPPKGTMIYGYEIPGGAICSLQSYTENRDSRVFPDPDKFDPERWMLDHESEKYKEMNRTMWTFSAGGRMCIGSQYDSLTHSTNRSLAMAEMQIALAAIYRKYYTKISPMMNDAMMEVDDGITSAGPVVHSPINSLLTLAEPPLLHGIPRGKRNVILKLLKPAIKSTSKSHLVYWPSDPPKSDQTVESSQSNPIYFPFSMELFGLLSLFSVPSRPLDQQQQQSHC
jgi:Cytochrome P450